jgi:DNA-binding NtrC family response regulator
MLDILLVDDEPSILLPVDEALRAEGYNTTTALDGLSAQAALSTRVFDVVISDVRLPKVDGFTLFKKVRHESPRTRFIMMTAYATVPDAVGALKLGAVDYLPKPFELDTLLKLLERIKREQELQQQFKSQRLSPTPDQADEALIGRSPPMERLRELMAQLAQREEPVAITGERGTGKELVAQALHQQGPRAAGPFVVVNCSSIPEGQHEQELFGLDGVAQRQPPRVLAAERGTLFIDDLESLSITAQARLLKLLDSGYDTRIITAVHEPLSELTESGRLIEPLARKLSALELRVPALRERGGDLMLLTEHLLRRFCAPSSPPELSVGALAAISAYPFPGNVRELAQVIRRAVVVSGGRRVELSHLPAELVGHDGPVAEEPNETRPLPEAVRAFEREYVKRALQRTSGRKALAAQQLGISRKNLWEKLKGYAITEEELGFRKSSKETEGEP